MIKYLKKVLLWIIILLTIIFFESMIALPYLKLNLTLVPVYYIGVREGAFQGCLSGIFTGFLEDAISGDFIGPSILSKGFIGIISSYLSDRFFIWKPMLGIISIFLLSMIEETIVYFSLTIFSKGPTSFQEFLMMSFIRSIINIPAGRFIKPKNA